MKNITVSVSDQAYKAARTWAVANCTSISAAVQAYIEILVKTNSASGNLELINRIRQQARARDRAARNEAAAQVPQSPASQLSPTDTQSLLRTFIQKRAESVQQRPAPA
jgi:hypothetical protein